MSFRKLTRAFKREQLQECLDLEPEVGEEDGQPWRAPVARRRVNAPRTDTRTSHVCRDRDNPGRSLIGGHVDPRLRDARLIGGVTVVRVAALHETSRLVAIALGSGGTCRKQWSACGHQNSDTNDGRQFQSHGHDA
jgi:hypothetical protein